MADEAAYWKGRTEAAWERIDQEAFHLLATRDRLGRIRALCDELDRAHAVRVEHPSTDIVRRLRAILDASPADAPEPTLETCAVPRCGRLDTHGGFGCDEHYAEFVAWQEARR